MARILLAEDDEIMRITIQDRLEKHQWHVDAVPSGKEAAEQLKWINQQLVDAMERERKEHAHQV